METTSRGSLAKWLIGAGLGLVVLAAVGVYALTVYLPDLVYSRVRAEMKAAGVELQACAAFDFKRDGLAVTHVVLKQCTFMSALPMKPSGSLEQVDIDLVNNEPTAVAIVGAEVTLVGELQVLELMTDLKTPTGVEVTAQRSKMTWLAAPGEAPRLQVTRLQRLGADQAWSGDVVVGEHLQGQFVYGKDLSLSLEQRANPQNTLRLRVDPSQFFGTLELGLDGFPMTLLSGVIFHNVPPELLTVQLSGNARFELPFGLNPKQPKGHFKFSFQGLNFPVPREVAGLVYDTSPAIEGDVVINRTFNQFKVGNLTFATGSLRMKGTASIERTGTETRWRSTLHGPLPCTAIAAAAAKIHLQGLPLGPELAQAASRLSKQMLKGSVEIFVALDAHSTDLAAAKLVKTIGIGCGLKPLPLVGVAQDLLNDLRPIGLSAGAMADLLKDLPALSDFPPLPKVPLFGKKQAAGAETTSARPSSSNP